ncbi:MAG: PLD nuclease N-terminal domain-containing protein [Verrucomicrobiota bacterium]|nr:PLD nuclease N-terminal domain-containing protein [Verrucomicrobiota bacterium]
MTSLASLFSLAVPDLLLILVALLIPLFTLWMAVDCALHESSQGNDKIVWLLIILLVPFFGAVAYLLIRILQRPRPIAP